MSAHNDFQSGRDVEAPPVAIGGDGHNVNGDVEKQITQADITRLFGLSHVLGLSREDLSKIDVSDYTAAMKTSVTSPTALEVGWEAGDESTNVINGLYIVAELVTATPALRQLDVNEILSDRRNIESLVASVSRHPALEYLYLRRCSLGLNRYHMAAVVPLISCSNFKYLNLSENSIGSQGAVLISLGLATNPTLEELILDDNCISDEDTFIIAESMKQNTHLKLLHLMSNNISASGAVELIKASFDQQSLNTLHGCNHTCDIYTDYWNAISFGAFDDEALSSILDVPLHDYELFELISAHCRKGKLLVALNHNHKHLEGVPCNLLPQVLHFLQEALQEAGFRLDENSRFESFLFAMFRSIVELGIFNGSA